jgi:hypothetical protein
MPDERRPSRTGPCAAPAPPASARPTLPPGPTFRSCSPDRADSCRPLDRLGRYESDCTARACLAPLSRSANSLQVTKLILPLEPELAIKAAGGLDADHGIFGGTLPSDRSPLRGNRFPEPSAYRQDRELAEAVHALAGEGGLRQAAKRLGIHRDALKAAFGQWACRRWRGGWAGSPGASL